MSSTQEKLVDIINGFIGNENLVESSWCDEHKDGLHVRLEVGQQHYIIKQLTQLIDSAKREGYKQGYIDAGIKALTEQSEESDRVMVRKQSKEQSGERRTERH